jgi:hypothetical protein
LIHQVVDHQRCSECDAVLWVVFLGATLELLLRSVRSWRRNCATPLAAWSVPAVFVASLPPTRHASFPFLQVFRL